MTLLKPLWRSGREQLLTLPGEAPVVAWFLGAHPIARRGEQDAEWVLPWPWRLLISLPLDSRRSRE